MQRLRPLSEAECYARCYGERDDSVTLLGAGPHPLHLPGPFGGDPLGSLESRAEMHDSEPDWAGWAALVPFPQRPA